MNTPTKEAVLEAIQLIAESEQTTVEAVIQQVIEKYQQEKPMAENMPTQKWAAVGIIDTGYNETGTYADEILANEWEPD